MALAAAEAAAYSNDSANLFGLLFGPNRIFGTALIGMVLSQFWV